MIGCEGVVGIHTFLGGKASVHTSYGAVTQIAGQALRMRAKTFERISRECGAMHTALLRYTHTLLTQTAQSAACNRRHTVDERLCRWLLSVHDRVRRDSFNLTQEFIASMLGVRRSGITVAASKLQDEHLISYRRGHIRILDREGLEASTCECYHLVKAEFDRALAN